MRWADVRFVYAGAIVVVVLAIAYSLDFTRRRHLLERIGHVPQLAAMAASASAGRRGLKAFLMVLGTTLVTLARARPQFEGESQWRQRGIDVAIVVDFSKSMLAHDVYPSRIERARLEAEALIDSMAGSRVALVAFAGAAIHYPLTHDYEVARLLLAGLSPLDMAPGSDLGEALRTARCILRPGRTDDGDCAAVRVRGDGGAPLDERDARAQKEAAEARGAIVEPEDRARAIVLFTDGEDTEGRARAEAERAVEMGIETFVVGIGTSAGERIPEVGDDGAETGWKLTADGKSYVITRLDEETLREVAKGGGPGDHYFPDDPRRMDVEGLKKTLAKLKEGDLYRLMRECDNGKNFGALFWWRLKQLRLSTFSA
mgnify:CR=1 FL=1